jgi:ferredoxin
MMNHSPSQSGRSHERRKTPTPVISQAVLEGGAARPGYQEFCPISAKAIWVIEEGMIRSHGNAVNVQRSRVAVDRCAGCGICENVCLMQDKPAAHVTSIGETRSRTNPIRRESGAFKESRHSIECAEETNNDIQPQNQGLGRARSDHGRRFLLRVQGAS